MPSLLHTNLAKKTKKKGGEQRTKRFRTLCSRIRVGGDLNQHLFMLPVAARMSGSATEQHQ